MSPSATAGIAVLGDVFCDIIIRGVSRMPGWGEELFGTEPVLCPGGVANVAVGTATLGVDTHLLARTKAQDTIGDVLAEELAKREHLQVSWLEQAPSTALTVALPMGSERAMISYVPPADGRPLAARIPWDALHGVRHLHVGSWDEGEAPLNDQAAILGEARERGITTSVDVSLQNDPQRVDRVRGLLGQTDLFLPNRAEACQIADCDDPHEALGRLGELIPTVVVKLGGEGAIAVRDGAIEHVTAPTVDVVDTTGAGDAFAAGFLYGHLRRWSLRRCLELGTVCGSIAVGRIGSSVSVPTRREAFRALEQRNRSIDQRTPSASA
jgi:sugar/nucleoside kinase (ribokinase family)